MLSYEINASILTIRAFGTPTLEDRILLFDAIRTDPAVPRGALVLLDIRGLKVLPQGPAAVDRLRALVEHLGPKLGWMGAMVIDPPLAEDARTFQAAAKSVGLRVEIFSDVPSAEKWLRSYGEKARSV